jgi:hypothetical protein
MTDEKRSRSVQIRLVKASGLVARSTRQIGEAHQFGMIPNAALVSHDQSTSYDLRLVAIPTETPLGEHGVETLLKLVDVPWAEAFDPPAILHTTPRIATED